MGISSNSPPSLSKIRIVALGSISYACAAGATYYDAVTISLPVVTDKVLFVSLQMEGANFPRSGLGLTSGNNAPDILSYAGVTAAGGMIDSQIMASKLDPTKLNLLTSTAPATGAVTQTYTAALAKDLSIAKTAYIKAYSGGADTIKINYAVYYLSN